MKYYVYRTYFLPTGQQYIGKTNSVEWDKGYHGSGTDLRYLLKSHEIEKFKREILHTFDTEDEAYEKERELVTLEYCKFPYVLNRRPGGKGGYTGVPHTPKQRKNHLKVVQSDEFRENHSKIATELWKDVEYQKKLKKIHNTPEAKENRSKAAVERWKDEEYRKKKSGKNHHNWEKFAEDNPKWIEINLDELLMLRNLGWTQTAIAKYFGFKSQQTTASKLKFLRNKHTKQATLF